MTPRDPRFDPRPGDFRRDANGEPVLQVLAVGDDVHAVYVKSGVEASWPWELWRERMGTTPREDWGVPTTATAGLPDAFLYAAYAVGVVVLGVVAGLCVLAVGS